MVDPIWMIKTLRVQQWWLYFSTHCFNGGWNPRGFFEATEKNKQHPNSDETSSKYNGPPISGHINSPGPKQGHVNWQNCQKKYTWNPKHPFISGCFNWMIPILYIGNGCFTKHPIKNGCLEYQVYIYIHT